MVACYAINSPRVQIFCCLAAAKEGRVREILETTLLVEVMSMLAIALITHFSTPTSCQSHASTPQNFKTPLQIFGVTLTKCTLGKSFIYLGTMHVKTALYFLMYLQYRSKGLQHLHARKMRVVCVVTAWTLRGHCVDTAWTLRGHCVDTACKVRVITRV